jgi:hypothetical protein
MAAMLRTTDMQPVYDELRERIMRGNRWVTIVVLASSAGLAIAQAPQSPSMGGMTMEHTKPSGPVGPLKITFEEKSAEWTPATLAALPHTTVTVYNEHAKATQTYSGVALIDLLKPLGVPDKPHGKEFQLFLLAEGVDGYKVVYSIGEVSPDVHDGTVIVADSQDGKPIADDGPLKLVTTGEKRPARWVRNLMAIQVLTAH